MAESVRHMLLVAAIVEWIHTQTDLPKEAAILVSNPGAQIGELPPNICGSVPDVFAGGSTANTILIGEAKTAKDIETQRSRRQFTDYLNFLAIHPRAMLVVAVPWHCTNQVRSLLGALQQKTRAFQVQIVVLDKLAG